LEGLDGEIMRNTKIGTIVVLLSLLVTALAVPGVGAMTTEQEVGIVCANSLLADFTENVVGDLARVDYLMPAGVCPSHYDSKPSDATLVAEADIIVMMGWEGWMNNLITSTGKTEVPQIKCMGLGEQNLPEHAKLFVDEIAAGLAEAMPEHASTIEANAAAYKAEIDAKASELLARVEAEGMVGRKVVVMEWWEDFVEWLGFEVVAMYGPPEGLSVQDQLNVTEAASSGDVTMVIDNLQSGTDFGANVASTAGVSHVVLTNFPGSAPGASTYLDMIDQNTDGLIEGVGSFDYKQGDIADLEQQVEDLELQNTMYLTLAVIFILCTVFLAVVLARSRSRGE
jgi:ABC-type Zn uptake system ZnuABC Zn-binding protein ZnuA